MEKLDFKQMEELEGGMECGDADKFFATLGTVALIGGFIAAGAATGGLVWGLGTSASILFGAPATVGGLGCAFA